MNNQIKITFDFNGNRILASAKVGCAFFSTSFSRDTAQEGISSLLKKAKDTIVFPLTQITVSSDISYHDDLGTIVSSHEVEERFANYYKHVYQTVKEVSSQKGFLFKSPTSFEEVLLHQETLKRQTMQ